MSTSTRRGFLGFVSATAAGLLPGLMEAAPAATETAPACILTPQARKGRFIPTRSSCDPISPGASPAPGPPPGGMGGPMFGRPIKDRPAALVPGLKPAR